MRSRPAHLRPRPAATQRFVPLRTGKVHAVDATRKILPHRGRKGLAKKVKHHIPTPSLKKSHKIQRQSLLGRLGKEEFEQQLQFLFPHQIPIPHSDCSGGKNVRDNCERFQYWTKLVLQEAMHLVQKQKSKQLSQMQLDLFIDEVVERLSKEIQKDGYVLARSVPPPNHSLWKVETTWWKTMEEKEEKTYIRRCFLLKVAKLRRSKAAPSVRPQPKPVPFMLAAMNHQGLPFWSIDDSILFNVWNPKVDTMALVRQSLVLPKNRHQGSVQFDFFLPRENKILSPQEETSTTIAQYEKRVQLFHTVAILARQDHAN